jgi:hypothetical protein
MRTTEFRLALRSNGYDPLPTPHRGKQCFLTGWPEKIDLSPEEIRSWEKNPDWNGTGANSTRTVGLDIDLLDPEAAENVRQKIYDRFSDRGSILERGGRAPKFLVPFRADTPFPKIVQTLRAPNGDECRIEMLGRGQQFIVDGIHETTGRPYAWRNGRDLTNTIRDDLPGITAAEAREFVQDICNALIDEMGYRKIDDGPVTSDGRNAGGNGHDTTLDDDVVALLATMSHGSINDTQRSVIAKLIWRGWHPDSIVDLVTEHTIRRARALNLRWKDKVEKERRVVAGRVRSTLKNLFTNDYDHAGGEIPPWLAAAFHADWVKVLARGHRPELRHDGGAWVVIDVSPSDAPRAAGYILTAQEWLDRTLPPSEPLVGSWFTTTSRVQLSADTGLGKTNFCLALAAHMAAGIDFLHWPIIRPARVLYVDGEMPRALLQRRVVDATRRLGIVPEGLFVFSHEDIESFPPLNTPTGLAFLMGLLDEIGGIQ